MKLPNFRRLFTEDYPKEYKKLIDIISVSLNNGIEVLYNALNNGLTLRDNVSATVKDVIVTVDANGTPTQASVMVLNNTSKVDGVIVIMATNQTNALTFPSGAVFVSGTQSGNTFILNNVNGLQAGQRYLLRLVAFNQ